MSHIIKKHETTRIELTTLSNALAELDEIYQGMTMIQMRVFITIASHEPITASELTVLLSSDKTTICRCVHLVMGNRIGEKPMDLA